MSPLALLVVQASAAEAPAVSPALFERAALEYAVPEELLVALAFEASRFQPDAASAWGGYGLYDLREDEESFGPGIERVSILLGQSPDAVRVDPELQIRGAAALMAWHGENLFGELPDADDLEAWAPVVRAFSGRQEGHLQDMFVSVVYEIVQEGVFTSEIKQLPVSVDPEAATLVAPPMASGDYYGNYQFVSASSSNYSDYSRGPSDIDYIVIHTVQGSYSGCISWFQNSSASVSAHYVVRSSDGQVTQMVWEEDVAWHAGNWSYNLASVGIEHEGYVDQPDTYYTSAMYESSAELSSDIVDRNSISLDRSHIIAHSEVPSATHTDPGSGWDWDRYMDLIGGVEPDPSAQLLGVVAVEDIYSGERLSGVTVKLDQTGETDKTDSDGWYTFDGLSAGTWSVTVNVDGYETGTCETSITTNSGQWWCSVALVPGEPDPQDSDPDTDPQDDTGPDFEPGDGVHVPPPGARVGMSEATGCSSLPFAGGWLGLIALLGLRRRS
jgi:N-acetyl-anhydromuramyl-L-alanine amidase AmpD